MLYRANVAALLFCIVCVGLAKPMRGRGQIRGRGTRKGIRRLVVLQPFLTINRNGHVAISSLQGMER
jgi:hypothetical protein